jgi:hypothetical protein
MWTIAGVSLVVMVGLGWFFQSPQRDEDWVDEHHGYGTIEDAWDTLAGSPLMPFAPTEGRPTNIVPLHQRRKAPSR